MKNQKELKKLRTNIRAWSKRAIQDEPNQRLDWYKEAVWIADGLAEKYNVSEEVVADIVQLTMRFKK